MTVIVVLGLVVVVILVVVLVALGMRASRQAREDDGDWVTDEQQQPAPRGRRGGLDAVDSDYGTGTGYERRVAGAPLEAPLAPSRPSVPDLPVAGAPLSAPVARERDRDRDRGEMPGFDEPPARQQPPAAPAKPAAKAKGVSRRSRATEEMGDDDYWATITFDKPKFPWQHDNGQRPQGEDPLTALERDGGDAREPAEQHRPEPARADLGREEPVPNGYAMEPATGYGMDLPVTGGPLSGGPVSGGNRLPDFDAPSPALAGMAPSDPSPLGAPVAGLSEWAQPADQTSADPLFTTTENIVSPPHPSTMATQNFSVDSLGSLPRPEPRPADPTPSPITRSVSSSLPGTVSSTGGGRPGAEDPHRLPTVDELLQKIQNARTTSPAPGAAPAPPSYGSGPDPLNDPLSTSSSWSAASSSTSGGFDAADPLGTSGSLSGYSSGGYDSGGYDTGGYDSGGYRTPSSPGYSGDTYPTAPAYGADAPRFDSDPLSAPSGSSYDDPLSTSPGGYSSAPSHDSYGSYGTGGAPSGGGEPSGRYGDFSGSNYGSSGGATDPLQNAYGSYGQNGPGGGYPAEPSYGSLSGDLSFHSGTPGGQEPQDGQAPADGQDDWDTFRYRR